jgi:hypothetical protein
MAMRISLNAFYELFGLAHIFLRTRQALLNYLAKGGVLEEAEVSYLSTATLSHIDDMRDGFQMSLRASEAALEELRYLVEKASLFPWEEARHDEPVRHPVITPELKKLSAIGHARVVFGVLPLMPPERITYPSVASYRDIRPPSGPADLVERIEELERAVWDTALQRPPDRIDRELFRRTYAFFEAASWLAEQHLRMLQGPHQG